MKHLDLLGMELKNEALCDLFETFEVKVVYEYDRLFEDTPDMYHAEIPELGLQFIFDENQVLKTLFMQPIEVKAGFNPFDGDDERLKRFDSKVEALQYAEGNSISTQEGQCEFMGEKKDWVKFVWDGSHSIHYEYVNSKLKMITIQALGDV